MCRILIRLPNLARPAHEQRLDPLRQFRAVDVDVGLDVKIADRFFADASQAADQFDVQNDGHVEEQRMALVDPDDFQFESVDGQRVADSFVELIGNGAADNLYASSHGRPR